MTELSQPKKPHFSFASQELPELQCKLPLSAALKNSGRQICSCIIGILDKLKRNVSYDNRLEQEAINPSIPPSLLLTVGGCSIKEDGGRGGEEWSRRRRGMIYLLPFPALIFHSDWRPSANDEGGSCESAEALQVHGKVNTVQSL